MVFKITIAAPFKFVEVFCKNPFLALYFSDLSSSLLSAALFVLTIWLFGLPQFFLR